MKNNNLRSNSKGTIGDHMTNSVTTINSNRNYNSIKRPPVSPSMCEEKG